MSGLPEDTVELIAAAVAARVEARVEEFLARYRQTTTSQQVAANDNEWIPEQKALALLDGRYSQRTLRRMRQKKALPHRLQKRGERDRVFYRMKTIELLRDGK